MATRTIPELTERDKERFTRKVNTRENGCWNWSRKTASKYPMFKLGRLDFIASRIAFKIEYGHTPEEMDVCHSCDNPRCVNPAHLFLGTAQDNADDMVKKGRHRTNPARGSDSGPAKLVENQIIQIRELRKCGVPVREIASIFSISWRNIYNILAGDTWRHI